MSTAWAATLLSRPTFSLSFNLFNFSQNAARVHRALGRKRSRCSLLPSPAASLSFSRVSLASKSDGDNQSYDQRNANDDALKQHQQQLIKTLRSMRVRELKSELESLSISTKDAYEKEELVQRLYRARMSRVLDRGLDDDVGQTFNDVFNTKFNADDCTIATSLHYYELESSQSIAARNANDIFLRPSPGKYAAIKVRLQSTSTSNSSVEWTLLVDTACSGLVLSPTAISRANDKSNMVRLISAGSGASATMMTAGGSQGGYDVAKWDGSTTKLEIGGFVMDSSMAVMSTPPTLLETRPNHAPG